MPIDGHLRCRLMEFDAVHCDIVLMEINWIEGYSSGMYFLFTVDQFSERYGWIRHPGSAVTRCEAVSAAT